MIHGERDMMPKSEELAEIVPDADVAYLDRGHWIQQERPKETTRTILERLVGQDAA